jgi:FtsP/CotA-like multicopper oxidase with cupredoxin domain
MPMPSRRAVLLAALAAAVRPGPTGAQDAAVTTLRLQRRTIEVNGKPASVFGIFQPDGSQGLRTEVGKAFRVRVENQIGEPSLIHWHGLAPPWRQDGVPEVSAPPIPVGGSAEYDFPLAYGGTFWMHSHQGLQEQQLLDAPLIIHDARDRAQRQQVVVMLGDFSFTPPEEIFAALRRKPAMPGMGGSAMPGMAHHTAAPGKAAPPDLNDVTYDAFLANERTLADPETVKVEPGAEVLLRIVNSSSMTNFHVDLGRLDGELTAVDGTAVAPIRGRRFPLAVAQRLDLVLRIPPGARAYPVLATVAGERSRTGVVLVAGGGAVARISDQTNAPEPGLTMALERRLRAAAPLAPRKADRVHYIDLTGEMAGYVWSLNNIVWSKDAPPLPVKAGERVELVMVNRTQMPHPMHLHGHRFQVVEIDGARFSGALRDTVLVPSGGRVVAAFDADNPGLWAFHCHMLYHMEAGMFTTIKYV